MAEIVGCFAMSHAPQVMIDPDRWELINKPRVTEPLAPELRNLSLETKWERWKKVRAAIDQVRERIDELAPDAVLVIGDDQHENMTDDNMPPFTIFIGDDVEASASLKYRGETLDQNRSRYAVDADLGRHLIDDLMESGFDPSYSHQTRYAGGLGHAFARALKLVTPDARFPIVPVMVNTYYPPAPSARRCAQFGEALASAIARFPGNRRVAVLASGGLSHTRIDLEMDATFVNAIQRNDRGQMEAMRSDDLVDGTSEIRCWVVAATAADRPANVLAYEPLPRVPEGNGVGMGVAEWVGV
jgi:Catalytic LigB subunit of aromatic ring-opening dioxygenase